MSWIFKIAGEDRRTVFESVTLTYTLGLQGQQLSFDLYPDEPEPTVDAVVEFSWSGVSFKGLLQKASARSQGLYLEKPAYTAVGWSNFAIEDEIAIDASGTVSQLAFLLLQERGITVQVIGEDREAALVIEDAGKGARRIPEALEYLASRYGYRLLMTSTSIELIDRNDPPTLGMDFVAGETIGWNELQTTRTWQKSYNEIRVHGGVRKDRPEDDDEENKTLEFLGDGTTKRFDLDPRIDEVSEVTVDGDSVVCVPAGSPLEATADCVFHRFSGQYWIEFAVAPSGPIVVTSKIQRAYAEWSDPADQAAKATAFPGSNGRIRLTDSRPELRTSLECAAWIETIRAKNPNPKLDASLTVWQPGTIFLPGRVARVAHPGNNFDAILTLQQNSLKPDFAQGGWRQDLSFSNGADGDVPGAVGGLAGVMRAALAGSRFGKTPPRVSSTATPVPDFTMEVEPTTQTITESGSVEYDVKLTPVNAFAGFVSLSLESVPAGVNAVLARPFAYLSGTGTVTVKLTVDAIVDCGGSGDPQPGTYTPTVRGIAGTINRTVQPELILECPTGNTGSYDFGVCRVTDPLPYGLATGYEWKLRMGGDYTGRVDFSVISFNDGAGLGNASAPISYTVGNLSNLGIGDERSLIWYPQPVGWNQEAYAQLVFRGTDEEGGETDFTVTLSFGMSDPSPCS